MKENLTLPQKSPAIPQLNTLSCGAHNLLLLLWSHGRNHFWTHSACLGYKMKITFQHDNVIRELSISGSGRSSREKYGRCANGFFLVAVVAKG